MMSDNAPYAGSRRPTPAREESTMAGKDKGSKNTKTAAAKTPKEKKLAKRAKKEEGAGRSGKVV